MQIDMKNTEQSSATAADPVLVKHHYSKRNCQMDDHGSRSSPSGSRQNLPPITSSTVSLPEACNSITSADPELFDLGEFYEIDHEQLLPKSPIHLKDIRVAKVTEKTRLNVTVSFPSALSLRTYFKEEKTPLGSYPSPHPELDEQFVMGFNHACKILRRLIPSCEAEAKAHKESFWLVALKDEERDVLQLTSLSADENDKGENLVNIPVNSCLQALKNTGLVGWGLRRKVKYIGRHRGEIMTMSTVVNKEQVPDGREDAGRKRALVGRKRKKTMNKEERRVKRLKQDRDRVRKNKILKGTKDRWSSERYEAAELRLLEIMKAKGALLGNPILRPALREEARKHIGDTGLLDHLLKHMAGKVVGEANERFRRRHNPEGAMEYWLEPAELQDMRRRAGVMDPFWMPPPGWQPGEPTSPHDVACGKVIEHLKEEVVALRREIELLRSLKQEEKGLYDVQSQNDAAAILKLQESYERLAKSNAKLEEQVASMATNLQRISQEVHGGKKAMELESERQEKSSGVTGDDGVDVDGAKAKVAVGDRRTYATDECNNNNTTSAGDSKISRDGGMVRRSSGFRICKPQGTFLWPDMGNDAAGSCSVPNPSDNGAGIMTASPSAAVPAEVPTPRSASSTTSPPPQRAAAMRSPSSPALPRAPVVIVAPSLPRAQQGGSAERIDGSDNVCPVLLQDHVLASALGQCGPKLGKWEPDGRSGGWSMVSTDLALSSSCYHR